MAFKLYDKDKNGFVTKGEMNKLAKNLTKEQIDKVRGGDGIFVLIGGSEYLFLT